MCNGQLLDDALSVEDVVHRVFLVAPPLHHLENARLVLVDVFGNPLPHLWGNGRHVKLQCAWDHGGVHLDELLESNMHHVLRRALEHSRDALAVDLGVPALVAVLVRRAEGDGVQHTCIGKHDLSAVV